MDYGNDGNGYKSRSFGQRGGNGENGGGGGGGYRSASERSVIQIPGTHIGKIIGPAGRHINEMQRQFNVRIQINKMVNPKKLTKRTFQPELFQKANSDGTKDAEISGNNLNDIQDAIKAIQEQINAPFERRSGGFRGDGGRGYNEEREGGGGGYNNYSRGIAMKT
jgi:hypothetical protein